MVYGVNVDDLGDYRPGQRAARLHQAEAPLVDAGLTKTEIRELSRRAGLATWDRPASACLSSRIPYGTPVTIQNVKTVGRAAEGFAPSASASSGSASTATWSASKSPRKSWSGRSNQPAASFHLRAESPLGFHYRATSSMARAPRVAG